MTRSRIYSLATIWENFSIRNIPAGELKIATSDATALDVIGYVYHRAGLDNVATVLSELAKKIDAGRLRISNSIAKMELLVSDRLVSDQANLLTLGVLL